MWGFYETVNIKKNDFHSDNCAIHSKNVVMDNDELQCSPIPKVEDGWTKVGDENMSPMWASNGLNQTIDEGFINSPTLYCKRNWKTSMLSRN